MAEETPPPAAATEGAAPEGAAEAPPANKKKLLMIISGAVAVVGILVAVGVFFLTGKSEDAEAKAADAAHAAPAATAIYDVPEFTLNMLATPGEGTRFLKLKAALELDKAEDAKAAEPLLARLQDDWGNYLRQLRSADLQGSAAHHVLREGLLRRATQALDPIPVKAVYIREMLVQ